MRCAAVVRGGLGRSVADSGETGCAILTIVQSNKKLIKR
jgi:hypothetical protein